MDMVTVVAIIIAACLGFVILLHFYKLNPRNNFFVILLILFFAIWTGKVLGAGSLQLFLMSSIISAVFIGPIFYLFLKKESTKAVSRKLVILNLILPILLVSAQIYNLYINPEEDIRVTILLNAIGAILNLIYGIIGLVFILKLGSKKLNTQSSLLLSFAIVTDVIIIIASIVSLTAILYFTDDLELVNLSVNAPKIFEQEIHFWLMLLSSVLAISFAIVKLKPKDD